MLGYEFEIIHKKENKMWWKMLSRKEEDTKGFVLFPFHNMIVWKKQRYNRSKIKRYAKSFTNYKRNQVH
jgi:hypothetical protein